MNFDHEQLRRAVRAKRGREGLTLRDVEIETGVSRSTVSRFVGARGVVDVDTAARLAEFAGLPMSQLTGEAAVTAPAGDALKSIEGLLLHDPKLKLEAAKLLLELMRVAYDTYRAVQGKAVER